MKIKNIYLGSWFPSTFLHLEEFYNLVDLQEADPKLNRQRQGQLLRGMSIQDSELDVSPENFEYLKLISGRFVIRYFEDGLLIVSAKASNEGGEEDQIFKFYKNKLSKVLAFIRSRGPRGLEIIRKPGQRKTCFLTCEDVDLVSAKEFFAKRKEKIRVVSQYPEFNLYSAGKTVLVEINPEIREQQDFDETHFMEYLIYLTEMKDHLWRLLGRQRDIWDQAEEIIEGEFRIKDVPKQNTILTDMANEVANIESRLDQMRLNFDYRFGKVVRGEVFSTRFQGDFRNIDQTLSYIWNLYEMTATSLSNNLENQTSFYQDNQRNALNKLQLLFLVSVVAGFIRLGSIGGSRLKIFDTDDIQVFSGIESSFNLSSLIEFGLIAIAVTAGIYYLWNFAFRRIWVRKKGR